MGASMHFRAIHFHKILLRHFPLLFALLLSSWSASAFAQGRIVLKSSTIEERVDRQSWRLDLEVHLPKPPDIAHVPMKFEFLPVSYIERSLVDGQTQPQERVIPLQGRQALIESMEVGFMDAGSGQIQSRTRFTVRLTRDHGYEAGDYRLTIRESSSGKQIGTTQQLKLRGENPVIDRRSIEFTASERPKKTKKQEAAPPAAEEETTDEPAAHEDLEAAEEPSDEPAAAAPPPMKERPGGGCHFTSGGTTSPASWLFASLLLAPLFFRRRASSGTSAQS